MVEVVPRHGPIERHALAGAFIECCAVGGHRRDGEQGPAPATQQIRLDEVQIATEGRNSGCGRVDDAKGALHALLELAGIICERADGAAAIATWTSANMAGSIDAEDAIDDLGPAGLTAT